MNVMRWLLALLLVAPNGEIDSLIRALDAPAIEDRDAAHARLLASGPRALGPLRDALESVDGESRARIDDLLSAIVRLEEERSHDARERARLKPTHGLAFWRRAGDGGRVLEASSSSHTDWDFSRIEDEEGRVVRTERCQVCSPRLVLVHSALAVRPVVNGTFTWFSEYPIAFHAPKTGDRRRIGDFEIVVAWPEIHLVSLRGVHPAILADACRNVSLVLRAPKVQSEFFFIQTCRSDIEALAGDVRWCDCDGSLNKIGVPMSYERRVQIPYASSVTIDQVDCIRLVFRKSIEEPFEFTGPLIEP